MNMTEVTSHEASPLGREITGRLRAFSSLQMALIKNYSLNRQLGRNESELADPRVIKRPIYARCVLNKLARSRLSRSVARQTERDGIRYTLSLEGVFSRSVPLDRVNCGDTF